MNRIFGKGASAGVAAVVLAAGLGCGLTDSEGARLSGDWGGPHLAIRFTPSGADLEYDCASGSITQPVELDHAGRFSVLGVHVPGHGGPIRVGEVPPQYPARYDGQV